MYWQPYGAWERSDGSLVFLSGELWRQLERWRREDGDEAGPIFLREILRGMDDADDDDGDDSSLGWDDAEVFEDEEEEPVTRPNNIRRFSLRGLARRAFRFAVSRRRLKKHGRAVIRDTVSEPANDRHTHGGPDEYDSLVRINGTWGVHVA